MREIRVRIPDDKFSFLMKLLKSFSFEVEAKPVAVPKPRKMTPAQQEWVDDFRQALHEVELHQQGKIKLQTAEEFLAELRAEQAASAGQ